MKRFLLLALTAGLLSPIAANAETYWLLIRKGNSNTSNNWSIPIGSKKNCEEEKIKAIDNKNWVVQKKTMAPTRIDAICIKGK
jgi:hypothetical protein